MPILTAVRAILALGGLAAALAPPAFAHHSFAMFDQDKTTIVEGTVKELEWVNPHAWLHVMAPGEGGKVEEWSFEMGSPAQISANQGWKPDSIKAGDKISVQMHPLKDGSRGGSYMNAKMADGRAFGQPRQ